MVRSIVPVEILSTNNSRPSSIRSFTGEPAPSLPSSPPSTSKNWKTNQNQNQNQNTFLQRSSFHKTTDPDGTETTARDVTWKTNSFHQTTPGARTPTVILHDDGDELDGTNTTARDMTDPEAAAMYRTDSESPPSSADNNKSRSPQTKDDYYDVAASPHIQRLVSPSPLSSTATHKTTAATGREGTTSVSYSTRYATVEGQTEKEADPVGDVRRTESSDSSPSSSSSARQAYYDAADTYYVAEPSPMVDRSVASPAAKVTESVTYSTKYVHEPKYHYTTPNKQHQQQQLTKPRHQQPPPQQQRLRVVDLPATVPEYQQQQQRTAASSSSPDDSKETTPDSKTTTSSGEPTSSASSGASVSRNSNSPPEYYTTTTKTPFFRSPDPAAITKSQQVHKTPTSTTPVALTPSPKSRSSPGEESVLSTMTTDPDGHQIVRKKSQEPDEMSYGEYSSDTRMEEEPPQQPPRQNHNVSWLDSTGGTTLSAYTTETIPPDSTEDTITASSPTDTATTRSPVVGEVYMTSLKDDTRTTNTKPSSFRTTRRRGGGGNNRPLDFEDDVIDEEDQSYSNHSNVAYTTGGVGDSNHSNVAYTGGVGGAAAVAVAAVALAASGGGTDPDGTLPPSHDDDEHRSMTGESLEPTHNDEYDSFQDASAELNPYEDNDDSSYDEESFEDEGSRDKDDTSDDDDDVVLPNYTNNKDIENPVSSHASSASGGSHSSIRKPEPKHSKFPSVPMLIGMVVFIILGFGGLIAGLTWYLWDKQPLAPFPVPTTDVPTITLVPTDSPTRFMPSSSTPIPETFPDDETLLQLFATVFGTNEYSKVFTAVCASQRFEFGLLCSTTAGLAANWMLYEDPSRTNTIRRSDDGWIQRYLLVYLYYSTTNDRTTTWLSCNPLSKDAADPSTDTEIVERSSSVDNSCQFTYPTELPGGR